MTLVAVVAAVSSALLLGALWGLYGRLGDRTEGFVLAAGGGALMLAAVLELIVPAQQASSFEATAAVVLFGAAVFAGIDYLIDERWGDEGGGGLLAAVTLDGVPENLRRRISGRRRARGVHFPLQPARRRAEPHAREQPDTGALDRRGRSAGRGGGGGKWASEEMLALIRAFAGGAVIASLATEIFPNSAGRAFSSSRWR